MNDWAKVVFSAVCLPLLFVIVSVPVTYADEFIENFTSTQYRDVMFTSAWWDTVAGELKCQQFNPTLVATYATTHFSQGMDVSGNYAYVANGNDGLVAIDISDPVHPSLVDSYNTPAYAYDVTVEGNYAYVADNSGTGGVIIIDISNPSSLTLVGNYDTPGSTVDIAIQGNYAYVADYEHGVHVLDISNPASPTLVGTYDTPHYAWGITIDGDHAFVGDWGSGVIVLDISNPANPTEVGSYNTPGNAWNVAVSGDIAYVADGGAGIQVLDISDPTNPVLIGNYPTPGEALNCTVEGNYVYIADATHFVYILDVADPTTPKHLHTVGLPGEPWEIKIAGEYAFVCEYGTGTKGFEVIHIANPVIPALASGSVNPVIEVEDVTVSGKYAYAAIRHGGLAVFDISDPVVPTMVAFVDTMTHSYSIAVTGNYAYLGCWWYRMLVFDISDPTNPMAVGNTPGVAECHGIAISGNYAYLATGSDGLHIVNITNPSSPSIVGTYDTPDLASDVAVEGKYAYVADWTSGLRVIDISDPSSPTLAGSYNTPGYAEDIAVSGNYAYISDQSSIQVIDISDPTNPIAVGSVNPAGTEHGIAVAGDYAFVTYADFPTGYGIRIIDISDPTNPVLLGSGVLDNNVPDCAADGDYVYVANSWSGFQLFQVFERRIVPSGNVARSLPINRAEVIERIKLRTSQTGSITWEVSTDGMFWESIVPGDNEFELMFPEYNLYWRATLDYSIGGDYPVCDSLNIEFEPFVAIMINTFEANAVESGVELVWDITADEVIRGFNIYRKTGENDLGERVNGDGLIPPEERTYTDAGAKHGKPYWYTLGVVKNDGSEMLSQSVQIKTKVLKLALYQNYPNPFNPSTTISYALPEETHVVLSIFNLEGKLVRTLVNGLVTAGNKELIWNGRDNKGNPLSSGVYLYRLTAGNRTLTKKMVLLK